MTETRTRKEEEQQEKTKIKSKGRKGMECKGRQEQTNKGEKPAKMNQNRDPLAMTDCLWNCGL